MFLITVLSYLMLSSILLRMDACRCHTVFSRREHAEDLMAVENVEATTASLRSRKAPRFARGGL